MNNHKQCFQDINIPPNGVLVTRPPLNPDLLQEFNVGEVFDATQLGVFKSLKRGMFGGIKQYDNQGI